MTQNGAKRRKGTRIIGAQREAVLAAIAAGESDNAIGKRLRVGREAVAGVRASEDGQRVLAQVAKAGEASREEMLRVAGSVMIKGLRRLDETIEHIDPGDVPAALGPSLKMLFAIRHEHTGKNGEPLVSDDQRRSVIELQAAMFGYRLLRPGEGAAEPESNKEPGTGSND